MPKNVGGLLCKVLTIKEREGEFFSLTLSCNYYHTSISITSGHYTLGTVGVTHQLNKNV